MAYTDTVPVRQRFDLETGNTAALADRIVQHIRLGGSPIVRSWRGFLYVPFRLPAKVLNAEIRALIEANCAIFKDGEPIDPPSRLVTAVAASGQWEVTR